MQQSWTKQQIQALKSNVAWDGENSALEEKVLELNRHLNSHSTATFIRTKIEEWKLVEAIATEIERMLSLQES